MSIYDKAHDLANALKTSDEYRRLMELKAPLEADAEANKMVNDFLQKQAELQIEMMQGKQDSSKMQQVQKMYEVISANPKVATYLQAYMRFQLMMQDVSKIISDSVQAVVGGKQ